VEKSSSTESIDAIGEVIYSYLVTNTGNVTLTGILLSDDNDNDDMDCPGTSLAPGESMTCTASHTVTQAELDGGGKVSNTVTASSNEVEDAKDSLDIPIIQKPLIGLAKRVVSISKISNGVYEIKFEFLIKNYGNTYLADIQVTDDLNATFPLPTTFEVMSLSSDSFNVNWHTPPNVNDFNGKENRELLDGEVGLAVDKEGKITMVIRVYPANSGPFENAAIVSGKPPIGDRIFDDSSDGTDPDNTKNCNSCGNGDKDPTNNTKKTPIELGDNLFFPPIGVKTVDPSEEPLLKWKIAWINNTNLVAVNALSKDPIPFGTTFSNVGPSSGYPIPLNAPDGSTNKGVSCTDMSIDTITTLCYYEGPTVANPLGQIIWAGTIGSDFGITDPAIALNKINIAFNVEVVNGFKLIKNIAKISSDLNGDGDTNDDGEQDVAQAEAEWKKEEDQKKITPETKLPDSGFAPGVISKYRDRSANRKNSMISSNLWLDIPVLSVKMNVVGVPLVENTWDVSWLWDQAGWLEGSAFPSGTGNSVLTGHVYLPDGSAGPLVNLSTMAWGQKIILHSSGQQYIYAVQSVVNVLPSDKTAFLHEDGSWLTLITCKGFDPSSNSYQYRVVVKAKLVHVEPDANFLDIRER
jgi:LPXTG-site transpeptidase (sortase) family protein